VTLPASAEQVAARWQTAFAAQDLLALEPLLDESVRWGGAEDTPQMCHTRSEVLARLAHQASQGATARVVEVAAGPDAFLVELEVTHPETPEHQRERTVYQVLTVADGRITTIRGYPDRPEAAAAAGLPSEPALHEMQVRELVPILNVSNLAASFEWFGHLGWAKKWAWGDSGAEPRFGAIESGGLNIFLSQNAQGAPGTWLSVWVDNVDTVHAVCLRNGLEVTRPPQNEPWHVREMHVRHPDGHVLRISQGIHSH
jgi:ketosteroid isomerase-like protein